MCLLEKNGWKNGTLKVTESNRTLKFQILDLLRAGGATKKSYLSGAITHCIAGDDYDENELQEASEIHEKPGASVWINDFFVTDAPAKKVRVPVTGLSLMLPLGPEASLLN
jgi:hypothetical protein